MLPPKAKFVREIERGSTNNRTRKPTSTTPSPALSHPKCTFTAPSPPDMTYFARILRYQRYGRDGLGPAYASDLTLPVYEKYKSPYQVTYTERPGSPRGSAQSDQLPFDVAGYRRALVAATVKRRQWCTFVAVVLALLILIFGAGVLAFVMVSVRLK
ncbi:hypothetical protein CORC01_02678 [Colletotrichum orchidophilum]|uniref:Uncharacterized protein n=1 Tax=Colletotrichum orchidophilum TaxID=1209926 RepID=A0A1G4BKX0_9PEZI|nr:uncharacterized protein CORC01_02678 [Colletotrichum orchidophilum]OHF02099.1 hypothetical protein CORC01_02678 [Colletotrichum orchidophilum]